MSKSCKNVLPNLKMKNVLFSVNKTKFVSPLQLCDCSEVVMKLRLQQSRPKELIFITALF